MRAPRRLLACIAVQAFVGRSRVDCWAGLNVTTDGPLTVVLAGCGRTKSF